MEVATVTGGAGVVDVRGGAAALLYLNGEPGALDGDDCAGSIGRLWSRAKVTPAPLDLDYLVPTQAWPVTDWGTVARYRKLIDHGCRPVVLALRANDSPYSDCVLDGHHKLAAYSESRVPPVLIRIARLDAPQVTADEVRTHFPGSDTQYLIRALGAPRG